MQHKEELTEDSQQNVRDEDENKWSDCPGEVEQNPLSLLDIHNAL